MPTTDDPPPIEEERRVEQLLHATRESIGASERMPVRILVLFVVAAGAVTFAPIPANIIGAASIALLALDTALHRR